jgi:Icc-related predicted phosphoesterase
VPVGYPSNVLVISDYEKDRFDELIRFRIDFVLSLGDNPALALKDLYDRYRKPIFAVRGGRDGRAPFPKGVVDVHLRTEEYRSWTIGGFGGTIWLKDRGSNMWSEAEAEDMLDQMPNCDIFICHNPVAARIDKPGEKGDYGSTAIRNYITEKQPRIVYHGHLSESWAERVGDTAIIGIRGYKVVHL